MNDNDPDPDRPPGGRVRMVPLIGAIHEDGRFERYQVVELLRVPVEYLRRGIEES